MCLSKGAYNAYDHCHDRHTFTQNTIVPHNIHHINEKSTQKILKFSAHLHHLGMNQRIKEAFLRSKRDRL